MALKQLQLRGISRTPSDRMTEDGGVAESLNFQIEEQESAPVSAPKDLHDFSASVDKVLFVHKGSGYCNVICEENEDIVSYNSSYQVSTIRQMENNETIKSVSAIGNTLIINTNKQTDYALFKNGSYISLGSEAPFPNVNIVTKEISGTTKSKTDDDVTYKSVVVENRASDLRNKAVREDVWMNAPVFTQTSKGVYEKDGKDGAGPISFNNINAYFNGTSLELWDANQNLINYIKEKVSLQDAYNAGLGIHTYAQWVVVAVRLYDGTNLCTTPVLMNVSDDNPFRITVSDVEMTNMAADDDDPSVSAYRTYYSSYFIAQIERKIASKYFLSVGSLPYNWKYWSDIITSVDVYMSLPIGTIMAKKAKATNFNQVYERDGGKNSASTFNIEFADNEISVEDDCMQQSNYYLVKRYEYNEFNVLAGKGYKEIDTRNKVLGEQLAVRETLKNSDWKRYPKKFDSVLVINNRVIASGVKRTVEFRSNSVSAISYQNRQLSSLYVEINSPKQIDLSGKTKDQMEKYLLDALTDSTEVKLFRPTYPSIPSLPSSDTKIVFTYKLSSSNNIVTKQTITIPASVTIDETTQHPLPMSLIVCPDERADIVYVEYYIKNSAGAYNKLGEYQHEMVPSKYNAMSFAYVNLAQPLVNLVEQTTLTIPSEANKEEDMSNYLYFSDADNPFYYPEEKKARFLDTVIGAGLATKALSEGQFGQYPLIVFTERGIWAMDMDASGNFVNSRAVDRSICINKNCIVPLDSQIVFVSEDGVKMIQGSEVVTISDVMHGKPCLPGGDTLTFMNQLGYNSFSTAMSADTGFMAFMKAAQATYDSPGKRILFFNANKTFVYFYCLAGATWHKMLLPTGCSFDKVLSTYPKAEAVLKKTAFSIYDFTTDLEEFQANSDMKAVITTRAFDLGLPDVLKTINHIRIRGQYVKYDEDDEARVSYILLGSQDGINFYRIKSLRGKSWKLFRMVILARLKPTERISWVDIDYEPRFTNRLR